MSTSEPPPPSLPVPSDATAFPPVGGVVTQPKVVLTCPQCGSDAYYCTVSDHGTVNGPAVHCRRSPAHNAWSIEEWSRWASLAPETGGAS